MQHLQPRPVPGPREYALEFTVGGGLAPYEVHKELVQALEAAGAETVAKPEQLETVLAFPDLLEGERWAAAVSVPGTQDGVCARVRCGRSS